MSNVSTIEWTDASWNFITGCTEVSPGCDHCYAKTFAERFRGVPGHPFEQGFDLKLWPERLQLPHRWKKPRKIFVNSMSDLFHKDVPDSFILEGFRAMILANHHVYQILTKRPSRLVNTGLTEKILRECDLLTGKPRWPAHIWLGTSVESQDYTWRIEKLRQVPAPIRFISAEPLLGPLDIREYLTCCPSCGYPRKGRFAEGCGYCDAFPDVRGLSWVITGAESGHGARPMDEDWVRDLRNQCVAADVPLFYKQNAHNGHKIPTPTLDGKVWMEYPA